MTQACTEANSSGIQRVLTGSKRKSSVSKFSDTKEPVTADVFIHCASRYTRSSRYNVRPAQQLETSVPDIQVP